MTADAYFPSHLYVVVCTYIYTQHMYKTKLNCTGMCITHTHTYIYTQDYATVCV